MNQLPLIQRATMHGDRVALRSGSQAFTYRDLLSRSETIAHALLGTNDDLNETRVAYRVPPGFDYVSIQWGIWRAGGIAVPLSLSATEKELQYTLADADVSIMIGTTDSNQGLTSLCNELNIQQITIPGADAVDSNALPTITSDRSAMILYTSGTTSKPKGVVTSHACIEAQITSLVDAWKWQKEDRIPLFLPLHHIHGIINIMSCALWSGAEIESFDGFDQDTILARIAEHAYTVFMAVPTIYVKMIGALESMPEGNRENVIEGFSAMRLMVSGSAALPASVHLHWTQLTGQKLLERYGMTEIGMGLSNPYHGERRPGSVGQPLPGVDVRLRSEHGETITEENIAGEIQVRGKNVFRSYWQRPEATAESFDEGWFRTGDIAVIENGYYRIMGRNSVDIIKSGGYKLSALEIESSLLDHPAITQCAVVGVPDLKWGEIVAAAVVLQEGTALELDSLQTWCADYLSPYKIPRRLLAVESLPRNAMGKVTKPAVLTLFSPIPSPE